MKESIKTILSTIILQKSSNGISKANLSGDEMYQFDAGLAYNSYLTNPVADSSLIDQYQGALFNGDLKQKVSSHARVHKVKLIFLLLPTTTIKFILVQPLVFLISDIHQRKSMKNMHFKTPLKTA